VTDSSGKRLSTLEWMNDVEDNQFPVTVREISPPPQADAYGKTYENEELYKDMSAETFSLIKSLNKHTNVSPKDRAILLTSLIKSNRLPDTIIPFENAAWPKEWEVEWLNYVVQRQISAAAKRTLDDVLQHVASLLYSYQHGTQVTVHIKESRTRWCSLVLGYPYPYLPEERPRCLRFLNPDDVIQFMKRRKHDILNNGKQLSEKGEPEEPEKSGSEVPLLDYAIRQSPLFKHISQLASNSEEKERAKAHSTIDRLYDLWLQTQINQGGDGDDHNSNSVEKLNDEILDLLLPVRYSKTAEGLKKNNEKDEMKQKCEKLHDMVVCLDRFASFVKQHGASLCTAEDRQKHSHLKPLEISASEAEFEIFNIGCASPPTEMAPPIYTKVDLCDRRARKAKKPHPLD